MDGWELELFKTVEAVKIRLNLLKDSGVTYIPIYKGADNKAVDISTKFDQNSLLKNVADNIGNCQRCKLCHGRTNIVFGAGSSSAPLVFVGEGPGADEDERGEPFVGRAGQLLTKMITAMGFRREDVYICNVVKCRPPNNRDPEPDEIESCEPFLKEQLAIIRPKAIIGLGRYACQTLLKTTIPMSRLRGIWHSYDGIKFMPTFHPAYLLRNPPAKKEVWEDLQAVMTALSNP